MDGHLQRALGRNLRAYRREHGLSQEDLGFAWGWSRGYISALERGKCNLSLRSVEHLATLMATSPLHLLSSMSATHKSVDQ